MRARRCRGSRSTMRRARIAWPSESGSNCSPCYRRASRSRSRSRGSPADFDRLSHLLANADTPHLRADSRGRCRRADHDVVASAIAMRRSSMISGGGIDPGAASRSEAAFVAPRRVTPGLRRYGLATRCIIAIRGSPNLVFEGGDLAATPRWVFADVNLAARNLGRAEGDPRDDRARATHRRLRVKSMTCGSEMRSVTCRAITNHDVRHGAARRHDDRRRRRPRGDGAPRA